jgi:iron complex outermembrane recepter protein
MGKITGAESINYGGSSILTHKRWFGKKLLLASAAATLPWLAGTANAASEETVQSQSEVDEADGNKDSNVIIVTARKRGENLATVPLAITAFSQESLDKMGAASLADATLYSAGVQFQDQAAAVPGRYNSAVRFRGMDTGLFQPSQQIGTVFVDGIYVSGGVQSLGFNDVERVEIVRGPQSALFGRNTFGGAVNFITRTPGNDLRGDLSMELATYGTYDGSLSVEGPIIEDNLFFRVSGRAYGTGGQYTSIADGGKLGRERSTSLSATLYMTPSENFSAKARFSYTADDDGPPDGLMLGGPNSARGNGPDIFNCFSSGALTPGTRTLNGNPVPLRDFVCGQVPVFDADLLARSNTTLDPGLLQLLELTAVNSPTNIPTQNSVGLKRDIIRGSLQLNYEFGSGITISSSSGYNRIRANWIRDSDSIQFSNAWQRDPQLHEDFTQEFRIASDDSQRFTWLLGGTYFTSDFVTSGTGGKVAIDPNGELDRPLRGPLGFSDPFSLETARTIAVFGAVGFEFTDQFSIDLEGRWQRDKVGLETLTGNFQVKSSTFLPRAIATFKPTDSTTLYATFSKGNLPGFFNAALAARTQFEFDQIAAECGCGIELPEEKLTNYELGWKQSLFNGDLFFAISAYYMEWKNQKSRRAVPYDRNPDPLIDDPFSVVVVSPAGRSFLKGFELEGSFNLTENLSGVFNVNLADSEYKSYNCNVLLITTGNQDCSGRSSPRYPKWSGAFSMTYSAPLSGDLDWFIRPDIAYQGKSFTDESNLAYINDYWIANLRLGVEKENLRVEAFVKNLFKDNNYRAGASRNDFSAQNLIAGLADQAIFLTPPEKRTVGVKAVLGF